MIRAWRNAATHRIWTGRGGASFGGLDVARALDRLAALNAAGTLGDLGALRSIGLHKLKGRRGSQWAMTVNGPWRVCFEFRGGDAFNVEIVDYHKG